MLQHVVLDVVPLPKKSDIWIGKDLFKQIGTLTRKKVALLVDQSVSSSFVKELQTLLQAHLIPITGGEQAKSRQAKEHVENELAALGFDKCDLLAACGGGSILDLAGFVAATYHRGIRLAFIPSTLLAMIDASIGGKNGINLGGFKNILGTTYYPEAVFCDVNLLRTLSPDVMKMGLMEMCKHAILEGSEACRRFEKVVKEIQNPDVLIQEIAFSVKIKSRIVQASHGDCSMRDVLNFGHTIGHAIEALEEFSISHGAAVGMGMMAESYLAHRLGFLAASELEKIEAIIRQIGVAFRLKRNYSFEEWHRALLHDKKARDGRVRFVLLEAIGKVRCDESNFCFEVEDVALTDAIDWLQTKFFESKFEVIDAVCVDSSTK